MSWTKETTKAFLFDHDDTLVQTHKIKWQHNKFIAKKFYNKELTDQEILLHWGKPLGQMACALFSTVDSDMAMRHIEDTRSMFPKIAFVDTIRVLTDLRQNGTPIGVVTATSRSNFTYDSETLGLPEFDYVQTFSDTSVHKPDYGVFTPAVSWLSDLRIAPEQATYVGDGLHDMHAAWGAGLNFVGVTTGLVTAEEFADYGADSIAGLQELTAASVQ